MGNLLKILHASGMVLLNDKAYYAGEDEIEDTQIQWVKKGKNWNLIPMGANDWNSEQHGLIGNGSLSKKAPRQPARCF